MCHLLTFALQGKVDFTENAWSFCIDAFDNDGGGHAYPSSMTSYAITSGGCSCELVHVEKPAAIEKEIERRKKIYQKKGWPKAKIVRAIENSNLNDSNAMPFSFEVESLLKAMTSKFGEVQFMVHWHSGSFVKEKFTTSVQQLCLSEEPFLRVLNEDVRYILKAKNDQAGNTKS